MASAGVREPQLARGRQLSRTFKGTERAARNALRRFAIEVEDRQVDPTRMTVGELLDEWLRHSGPGLRPKTLANYRQKIETRIRPAFGSMRLDRLTGHMLDEQYREWRESGLSDTTVHHLATIIGTACRQAVKWGWIATNPVSMSTPPPLGSRPSSVPEPDELVKLIRAAEERKTTLWRQRSPCPLSRAPAVASLSHFAGLTSTSRAHVLPLPAP